MTTDVSAALATLQLHPEDSQALKALAALHPGNGAGIDAEVLSNALSDARRFHRERGDFELCRLSSSISSWPGRPRPRAAPTCCTRRAACCPTSCCATRRARPACARRWRPRPGTPPSTESLAQMSLVRANWEPISQALPAAGGGRRRIRRSRPASTARSPSSTSSTARRTAKARRYLRRSLELDPHNRRSGDHLERLLREQGQQRGAADAVRRSAPTAPPTARSARWPRSRPPSCATR